jgi:hypothetical protein
MLALIAAVLIVLWLLGFFAFHVSAGIVHILLIIGIGCSFCISFGVEQPPSEPLALRRGAILKRPGEVRLGPRALLCGFVCSPKRLILCTPRKEALHALRNATSDAARAK